LLFGNLIGSLRACAWFARAAFTRRTAYIKSRTAGWNHSAVELSLIVRCRGRDAGAAAGNARPVAGNARPAAGNGRAGAATFGVFGWFQIANFGVFLCF